VFDGGFAHPGYYDIYPQGVAVRVYCDASGYDFYLCTECTTFSGIEDVHGCPNGLQPWIPRSRDHWVRLVNYIEGIEGWWDADEFIRLVPVYFPEYDNDGCGTCCGTYTCNGGDATNPFNSDSCSDAVAADGGRWWISDEITGFPYGCSWSNAGDCFTPVWSVPSAFEIATGANVYFTDYCTNSGSSYVCSSNLDDFDSVGAVDETQFCDALEVVLILDTSESMANNDRHVFSRLVSPYVPFSAPLIDPLIWFTTTAGWPRS